MRAPARFWSDARGGVAVIAAMVIPALALLTCGAIDLAAVNADRSSMQDAADATALAMAKQLGIASSNGITARSQQYAAAQLGQISSADQVTVTTTIAQDNGSVTVAIAGSRPSFFGNLFPPGGWQLHAAGDRRHPRPRSRSACWPPAPARPATSRSRTPRR